MNAITCTQVSANGIIKVYRFNGSSFDDDSMPDIIIPGYTGSIYDLAYNPERNPLYASAMGLWLPSILPAIALLAPTILFI